MKPYKKRAKGGWNSCKVEANIRERNHSKKEIRQALQEEYEGEDYRYPKSTRKVYTMKQKRIRGVKSQIRWYEKMARSCRPWYYSITDDGMDWYHRRIDDYKHKIKIYKEKLKKLLTSN